ncbi:HAD family hydrolase [Mesohalobacter halotolerans]|uniref:HAD family hydrolase n=1 Tax=Mesohalobacter halotolerans TaxID=1883405 RepID=UPI001FE3E4A7|nr:HAD family hydrolase [Mesohalobacter halotolerans]
MDIKNIDIDFSTIKLVVSDMDGTLLNDNHEVSPRFFKQFKKLKALNIHFVAASGRQYHSLIEKLEPIKNQISIIAENGGMLQHDNELQALLKLSNTDVNRCIKTLRTLENAFIVLCSKHSAYIESDDIDFTSRLKEYYTAVKSVDDLTQLKSDEFLKIAVFHSESSEKHVYPHVKPLENDFQVIVSGQNWLDISHLHSNKAYALKKLLDKMGISSDQTLVFGDYNNDIDMMKLAKYSVAMKNAHPNVKRIAKFETHSNTNEGVEHILEQLIGSKY